MEEPKPVKIEILKIVNGQDICAAFFEEEEYLTLVHPLEMFYETQFNEIDDFEMLDWIPGSPDKVIRINKDKILFTSDVRDDIFDCYTDYINKQENVLVDDDLHKKEEPIDSKVIDLFSSRKTQ